MIATNCNRCCFLVRTPEGVGCAAAQFCHTNDMGQIVTPGCCRLLRKKEWKEKQLTGKSLEDCVKTAREEMGLKFHLIVVFNELAQTIEQLKRTVETDWHQPFCSEIIVADITGNESRKGVAVEYLDREYKKMASVGLKIDCVVESGEQVPVTIRRVAKGLTKYINYFMVVSAGQTVSNLEKLDQHLMNADSRAAFWHFPINCGDTSLIEKYPYYGLYLAKPYRKFSQPLVVANEEEEPKPNHHPFCVELQSYEDELGLSLTWLFDRCRLK